MTLFELLAGAAGAGVVAADLFAGDAGRVSVGGAVAGAGGAGLIEFALLFAFELALESVDGGSWGLGACGLGLRFEGWKVFWLIRCVGRQDRGGWLVAGR